MSELTSLSDYIPIGEIRRHLPSGTAGRRLAKSTVYRWCLRGVRGRRLRSVWIGNRLYTTAEWINQFLGERLPAAAAAMQEPANVVVPVPRHSGRVNASKRLDEIGFR